MSLDHELFLRDALEEALKKHPEYANLKITASVTVDGDRVTVREGVDSSELLR
jgi:predicted dinucleotide-utilizing enzyme